MGKMYKRKFLKGYKILQYLPYRIPGNNQANNSVNKFKNHTIKFRTDFFKDINSESDTIVVIPHKAVTI